MPSVKKLKGARANSWTLRSKKHDRLAAAGGYGKPEILEVGEFLTTPLLPGLQLSLTDLFLR